MKHMLMVATLTFGLLIHTSANALTIDFTEDVFSGPVGSSQTLVGDEWASYGITTSNVFWYDSSNDPFDGMGIANVPPTAFDPVTVGEITFLAPLNYVYIDWVTLNSNDIHINAFDSGGTLIDSYDYSGTGTSSGTASLYGDIASISFNDDGASVGISTITYGVPEPASLLLLGSGLFGIVAMRKKIIV